MSVPKRENAFCLPIYSKKFILLNYQFNGIGLAARVTKVFLVSE